METLKMLEDLMTREEMGVMTWEEIQEQYRLVLKNTENLEPTSRDREVLAARLAELIREALGCRDRKELLRIKGEVAKLSAELDEIADGRVLRPPN